MAYINNNYNDIAVEFLTYNRGDLFIYLSYMINLIWKYHLRNDRNEPFPNNDLFLSQVNSIYEDDLFDVKNELVSKLNGNTNIFLITHD